MSIERNRVVGMVASPQHLTRFVEGGSGGTAHLRIDFQSEEEARQMMRTVHRQLKRDFMENYE